MSNPIITATVKATGVKIKVYKLKSGGWANYEDGGKTVYQDHELIFD